MLMRPRSNRSANEPRAIAIRRALRMTGVSAARDLARQMRLLIMAVVVAAIKMVARTEVRLVLRMVSR